jgi:hypothetical protein
MEKKNAVSHAALAAWLMLGGVALPALADDDDDAHDRRDGAPADIVGAWKMMFRFTTCDTPRIPLARPAFPSLNTFFADGNLIESSSGLIPANRTISQGRWQQIGKRTVIGRSELQLFEGGSTYTGYQVLERTFSLSRDGNELTTDVRWTRFNTSNVVTFSGCATETGKRQPEPTSPPK